MEDKKEQLELDVEQRTDSKLEIDCPLTRNMTIKLFPVELYLATALLDFRFDQNCLISCMLYFN